MGDSKMQRGSSRCSDNRVKWLLLVRHVESVKNIEGRFASLEQTEMLTPVGDVAADCLAEDVKMLWTGLGGGQLTVLSGGSVRALLTAERIGKRVGADVTVVRRLRSIEIAGVSGRPESDLLSERNAFMMGLLLYRSGLLNSYDLPGMRAISQEFETEQLSVVDDALMRLPDQGMCVVVAHRSPITAVLIGIARLGHGYPSDFYGYVPLELGYCSLVRTGPRLFCGERPEILAANRTCRELIRIVVPRLHET
jgi:broad specificity phosphatase PhoE